MGKVIKTYDVDELLNANKKTGNIRLYTIDELTEMLGVTDRTLRAYCRDGKIKAVKMAGVWHVTEENLRKYLSGEND